MTDRRESMTTVSADADWPRTEIHGNGVAFLGKRCLNTSDCASKFIKGLTCNADDDGELGNCTCPDYTPLFLEEGGIYKCSRAGALGSSCERVEQCRYNNVYLLCLQGKCICPSPMRVKQGFKCMPETKLGGNCSTVDSCFTRSSVCVGGTCKCRIHYAQKGTACVYVGDTNWKIVVAYILPCIVAFLMSSIVLLAFCSVITQRYEHVLWGHRMPEDEQRNAADPGNDPSSGVCSAALSNDTRRVRSGSQVATTESLDNTTRTGLRFRQELASQQQLTDGAGTDSSFRQRRRNSYPYDTSPPHHSSVDLNAELMARLMASIERRLKSPPRSPRASAGVGPATPPCHPRGCDEPRTTPACHSAGNENTAGRWKLHRYIEPEAHYEESAQPFHSGGSGPWTTSSSSACERLCASDRSNNLWSKALPNNHSQEISSTVTYVPYNTEPALEEEVEWPTLRDEVLQERFPNLAALSEASINDAMEAVASKQESKPDPRSEAKRSRSPVEEELSGLGGEDLLLGVGLTADFMDTSNPDESFRLPRLKTDEMPLRFPQLAQLDQPAFRQAK
ncbi:hypothetical protein MTO96_007735 [Rhipicephalus appendiculatus]